MVNKGNNFDFYQTLNCKGNIISLKEPIIMGILNITDDSFYQGSRFMEVNRAVDEAGKKLQEGATILDIGGYSSRPGALDIPEEIEIERIVPAIEAIISSFPDAILSVDTFRSKVAEHAQKAGITIINDISAGDADDSLPLFAAKHKLPYIAMHKQGTPQLMHLNPTYKNVTQEVLSYLVDRYTYLSKLGINDVILDPGFGFGKNIKHNFQLLKELNKFTLFGIPILAGVSRKSMIWRTLEINASEALNGTTALHMFCLTQGAKILRVHDVKEARETITLYLAIEKS